MRNISYGSATYLKQRQGFTIVELLIVVVVIAILASITIVSYNGITKSARNSAVQSTLSQAAQKLEITRMNDTNDSYPGTLSAAGLNLVNSGDTTYTYAVSSDNKAYCLASSQSGRTFFVTSTIRNPQPGICTGTTGVPGTGEVATDGSSTAPPVTPPVIPSYSIFGTQAPSTTHAIYNDGGGSLKVGNRFYTLNNDGIKVNGLRIYNPTSSDSTFLSLSVTAQAYVDDWVGANITRDTTFGSSAVATKVYSTARTAGSWTDILFDSPFTLPKITSSSGTKDTVTLAVQFSGGNHYVFVTPSPNSGNPLQSSTQAGTYLSENSGVGRGVNTLLYSSDGSYYGIDILFSPVTP